MRTVIHRLSVPNPFFEGRNSVYLIKSDPLTLIDTGVATDKAYEHLCAGLHEQGVTPGDIQRVILTHKHIDHIGNAWRIQQASGAEILIHESECKSVADVDPTGKRFGSLVADRLDRWGVPSVERPDTSTTTMPQWRLEASEPTPIKDGQSIPIGETSLQVIHTPGHTMGSICLLAEEVIFVGDHVLKDISPNVGAGDMRSHGMLDRFMASLDRVAGLGDPEVFPGHGESFRGLAARCHELSQHHHERLEKTRQAIGAGARSIYEVAKALFGELSDYHVVLGCAEANAHVESLVEQGQARLDASGISLI